ncbi:MAG: sulfatase [Planctomycetota bacterium]|nr:sulfatase [Planctomycetota bacterium]MDA1212670.1 sulfatase [Planctomycetota bacterium]
MSRTHTSALFTALVCALWGSIGNSLFAADRPPNFVIIFIDDMGYADIGPFGADADLTPHLNRMAAEGRKFTDFVVSTAVCSASRVALMTGCYHRRVGIDGALNHSANHGLHADEITLGEICKQKNYATAVFGKWHLGHHPKFLPLQHGFDEYFGLPYSNDMWPLQADYIKTSNVPKRKKGYPNLPLIEGNKVVDNDVDSDDQRQLTTQYTDHAVDFIKRHRDEPFLVYLPHSMVHVPLFVSQKFDGKSGRGLFSDVIMEVDWSVGEILKVLEECGIDENTCVIFTADNGPWLNYGDHAGSAKPLREGKGTEWEGGIRVPTVMRWPGTIPAGSVCDELASTIDILPTIAATIGAELPSHPIDGMDIRPLMFGEEDAVSPHEAFYCYYSNGQLQGVRDRRWKLMFPHKYRTLNGRSGGTGGIPVNYEQAETGLELYDLKNDIGEAKNVIDDHPDIVARLENHAEIAREQLGDKLTNREGNQVRPAAELQEGDERLMW